MLGAVIAHDIEGDDLLGLLATQPDMPPAHRFVIASIDKDMKQIPGLHYNWLKPNSGVYSLEPEECRRFFFEQALMGDRTDGFYGCPDIGPKRADKILDAAGEGNEWEAIVAAYKKKGLSEDVALSNARCAWILRDGDYDWEKKQVRLWTPERMTQ